MQKRCHYEEKIDVVLGNLNLFYEIASFFLIYTIFYITVDRLC